MLYCAFQEGLIKQMVRNNVVLCLSGMALCGALNCSFAQPPVVAQMVRAALIAAPPAAISTMDKPFLFAYGTWQDKVKIENGSAILRGAGVTPKGGGGVNLQPPLDLSANPEYSPALKIKVGAANKMNLLRLVLRDRDGHSGTFEFALPAPGTEFVLVTPKEGASLAKPNSLDKPGQNLNLKQIMQWQFGGDYSGDGPLDVEISGIVVVAPSAATQEARAEKAKQDAAGFGEKAAGTGRETGAVPARPEFAESGGRLHRRPRYSRDFHSGGKSSARRSDKIRSAGKAINRTRCPAKKSIWFAAGRKSAG